MVWVLSWIAISAFSLYLLLLLLISLLLPCERELGSKKPCCQKLSSAPFAPPSRKKKPRSPIPAPCQTSFFARSLRNSLRALYLAGFLLDVFFSSPVDTAYLFRGWRFPSAGARGRCTRAGQNTRRESNMSNARVTWGAGAGAGGGPASPSPALEHCTWLAPLLPVRNKIYRVPTNRR